MKQIFLRPGSLPLIFGAARADAGKVLFKDDILEMEEPVSSKDAQLMMVDWKEG